MFQFGIHSGNGSVYVRSHLDRELAEEITLTVVVVDKNGEDPPFQSAEGERNECKIVSWETYMYFFD